MRPNRIFAYVQLGFVFFYLAVGLGLILGADALRARIDYFSRLSHERLVLVGMVVLAFAGYRAYMVYLKFFSRRSDD